MSENLKGASDRKDVFYCARCSIKTPGQWCSRCADMTPMGTYYDIHGHPCKPTARIQQSPSQRYNLGDEAVCADGLHAAMTRALDLSIQFERAMADVKTISEATTEELKKLRQWAAELGVTTRKSSELLRQNTNKQADGFNPGIGMIDESVYRFPDNAD